MLIQDHDRAVVVGMPSFGTGSPISSSGSAPGRARGGVGSAGLAPAFRYAKPVARCRPAPRHTFG